MELSKLQERVRTQYLNLMKIPNPIVQTDKYLVKAAETKEEMAEVFKLRFRVFNLEMHVGLDSAYKHQMDKDKFDDCALQLIVKSKTNNQVIATYRVQNYEIAHSGVGFCGCDRYDLSQMPEKILKNSLAVSRACIDKNHRSSKVFWVLWQGLSTLLYESNLRYFFGCSSIPTSDPQTANNYIALLEAMDVYHDEILIKALPEAECKYRELPADITNTFLPPLFNLYLKFKCRVCSEPCMHDEFKTLEFMIIYDYKYISNRQHKMLLGDRKKLLYED